MKFYGAKTLVVGLGLLVGAVGLHAANPTINSDMIVGGKTAAANKWPWQVRLFDNADDTNGFCGGSLIAKQWVLTAAHCVPENPSVVIGYGSSNLTELKRVNSALVMHHEGYDPNTMVNDIALIKLAEPVEYGEGTASADLADTAFFNSLNGAKAMVTGWGYLFDLDAFQKEFPDTEVPWDLLTPKDLQEVDVPIQNFEKCRTNYRTENAGDIPDGQMCAGLKKGGKDSCQGDSGGPLVAPSTASAKGWVQVGVVSWGRGCAKAKLFGIYTRTDFFRDWIKSTIAANK